MGHMASAVSPQAPGEARSSSPQIATSDPSSWASLPAGTIFSWGQKKCPTASGSLLTGVSGCGQQRASLNLPRPLLPSKPWWSLRTPGLHGGGGPTHTMKATGQLHEEGWRRRGRDRPREGEQRGRRGWRQDGRLWNRSPGWGLKGRPRMPSSGRWAWPILGTHGGGLGMMITSPGKPLSQSKRTFRKSQRKPLSGP